jgi:hypothetical protein
MTKNLYPGKKAGCYIYLKRAESSNPPLYSCKRNYSFGYVVGKTVNTLEEAIAWLDGLAD